MRSRIRKVLFIGAAVLLGGCAYVVLYTKAGISVPCLFHYITGLNCPGCGVTRMLLSILRFDFLSAFQYNAALFCLTPIILFLIFSWIIRFIRYGTWATPKWHQAISWSVVGILLIWGIARNLIGI